MNPPVHHCHTEEQNYQSRFISIQFGS